MNNFNSDLYRGSIDTIILNLLYEKDSYGYEILKEVNDNANGKFELKRPTLYSALKRLEKQGFVKAYLKDEYNELGGQRKYYTLTELGKEQFEKNKSEWHSSKAVIDTLVSSPSLKEKEEITEESTNKPFENEAQEVSISNDTSGEILGENIEQIQEDDPNKYDKYYVRGVLTKDIYSGKSILDTDESEDDTKFDKYYVKGELEKDIYSGEKKLKTADIENINKESDSLIEQIQNLYDEQSTTESVQNNDFFFSSNELDNYEPIQEDVQNFNGFKNVLEEEPEVQEDSPIQEEIERSDANEFTMYSDDIPTTTTSMFDKKAIETQLKKFENNEEDLYSVVNDYNIDNYRSNYVQESMDFGGGYIVGAVDKEEEYTREKDYKQILGDFLSQQTTVNKPVEPEPEIQEDSPIQEEILEEPEVTIQPQVTIKPKKEINYESLKSELLVEGIKLKEYQDGLQGDKNVIWKNKALFFTLMTVSLMMLVELIIIYLTSRNSVGYGMVFYGVCAGILFIPFLVGAIIYLKNRKCKVKDRFYFKRHLFISILVFLWTAVAVFLFAMILKINFASLKDVLTYIIIPIMFFAHYPIGIVIYHFIKKGKSFRVNKN